MSRVLEEDEDDIEIDASQFSKQTGSTPRKPPTVNKKGRQLNNSDNDVGSEKLMLSMRELKVLFTPPFPTYNNLDAGDFQTSR